MLTLIKDLVLIHLVSETREKVKDKHFLSFTADVYFMTNYVYESGAYRR
jgi:hypothetical protein